MIVTELFEYPIKSMRGIQRNALDVNPMGLGLDRRMMLVDEEGVFISQRSHPNLAHFEVEINEQIRLTNKTDGDTIGVLFAPTGSVQDVRVWDDWCQAVEVAPELSAWCSNLLNQTLRLVFMPDTAIRQTDLMYSAKGDKVGFADGFPILITNSASLDDLNARMNAPVPMDRFRSNIVVDGNVPFEEDHWRLIQIGQVVLRIAKPCARCQVITTDQHTGKRGKEPLHALSKFRKEGNKVLFGMNANPQTLGRISVGDEVIILE